MRSGGLLIEALTRNAGNITRAARDVEVSRPNFHDLLSSTGFRPIAFASPAPPAGEEADEEAGGAPGEPR